MVKLHLKLLIMFILLVASSARASMPVFGSKYQFKAIDTNPVGGNDNTLRWMLYYPLIEAVIGSGDYSKYPSYLALASKGDGAYRGDIVVKWQRGDGLNPTPSTQPAIIELTPSDVSGIFYLGVSIKSPTGVAFYGSDVIWPSGIYSGNTWRFTGTLSCTADGVTNALLFPYEMFWDIEVPATTQPSTTQPTTFPTTAPVEKFLTGVLSDLRDHEKANPATKPLEQLMLWTLPELAWEGNEDFKTNLRTVVTSFVNGSSDVNEEAGSLWSDWLGESFGTGNSHVTLGALLDQMGWAVLEARNWTYDHLNIFRVVIGYFFVYSSVMFAFHRALWVLGMNIGEAHHAGIPPVPGQMGD